MHSSDLLVEALNRYEGSYILVSHDRYFINKTANKIWEIVDHKVREFNGGYDEFAEWNKRMSRNTSGNMKNEASQSKGTASTPKVIPASQRQFTARARQPEQRNAHLKKDLQKKQKLFQQLEQALARITVQKQQLEQALSDPATYSNKEKFISTEQEYKKILKEFENTNAEYETLFENIVTLEAALKLP
jgi:ATP-binding cassette, subfamily F, member 3